ncbi:MAG: YdiU family protein [Pseudomonadota bacterium]
MPPGGSAIRFDNSFATLPERFFARLNPTPVAKPRLIRLNTPLATELGLDPGALGAPSGIQMLAGNAIPDTAAPLAMAYAGHQFGGWNPQLGDGRAVLLGEVVTPDGARRDIQLKGAGKTPFSRMGDGRAALGPVLREYIVSEAMAALGIPTTRALACVETGEEVYRETPLPGAILTRVASSHIRVGTFQYHVARDDTEALRLLADHVIDRHYPELADRPNPTLALLDAVIDAQARLIAKWMSVGFIHGVMNTDNMSVAGETIDYGPCAFMDIYHPDTVFSSIDQGRRYAYGNQPLAAHWNLAQFASSLLPILAKRREDGIAMAQAAVDRFSDRVDDARLSEFRVKLGLRHVNDRDTALINKLLDRMAERGADFTRTFRALAEGDEPPGFSEWRHAWVERLAQDGDTPASRQTALVNANPAIIPRNHLVEAAIARAHSGDFTAFHNMTEALADPFVADADSPYRAAPTPETQVHQTFCGT